MTSTISFLFNILSTCLLATAAVGQFFLFRSLERKIGAHARALNSRADYVYGRIDGMQAEISLLKNRLGEWPDPKRVDPGQTSPSVFD